MTVIVDLGVSPTIDRSSLGIDQPSRISGSESRKLIFNLPSPTRIPSFLSVQLIFKLYSFPARYGITYDLGPI